MLAILGWDKRRHPTPQEIGVGSPKFGYSGTPSISSKGEVNRQAADRYQGIVTWFHRDTGYKMQSNSCLSCYSVVDPNVAQNVRRTTIDIQGDWGICFCK